MEADGGSSHARYVSEEVMITPEQEALAEMAYRLSSSNVVDEHEDDSSTRREAKLLMSLSAFPQSPDQADLELISSSSESSDSSYMSDSSRAENFSFVCPSLSLESAVFSALQHAYRSEKRNKSSSSDQQHKHPGTLLGRPLKADDRDAVRLSADAMARNVYDSFRKAIEWRIRAWTNTLSKSIAHKEKSMLANGAKKEDLKVLLSSSEAALILGLQIVKDSVKVSGTRTNFTVLPQRVDKNGDHISKKRRVTYTRSNLEESEYQYTVAHALRFECWVELDTPVGFSQVSVELPGTIEGTFLSSAYHQDEMTFVSLDLNTDMLAAMVEKACRKIVRVSVEESLKSSTEPKEAAKEQSSEESTRSAKTVTFAPEASPKTTTNTARSLFSECSTPPQPAIATFSPDAVRAALVSPPSSHHMESTAQGASISKTSSLKPIPDDFDAISPRRISPQPRSAAFNNTFAAINTPFTPKVTETKGSMMVSPPPGQAVFHDHNEKGPSLPMLVEVACRAYRND
mmetsp:Transcript_9197/g.19818  ORF Transcript_9197/g.19818 Transcript_9197/m.19818 type:complete len:515 (-) Transcript_9197:341-1885(-)|eukprot:CAMPEP_0168734160 /NCGR_PEP_ID=MMETSP0724-20121128/8668_1 /TAXON_ID=265536 /ORGANISM="Amphiprora sp., Strain CCMP467" /LENGTH=514 /DNA_ID=CAMNT_0008781251 /DNA_START=61 /DNA_END=1605 /DNA_ORIENTATION=+